MNAPSAQPGQPASDAPPADAPQANVPTNTTSDNIDADTPIEGVPVAEDEAVEADTPDDVYDLNADKIDALLRDPNTPGDVRSFVQTLYGVDQYLRGVEFYKNEDDGPYHVRAREND